MYNTTWPHFFWKIFIDFLTSTLLQQRTRCSSQKYDEDFFQILWPSQNTQILQLRMIFPNLKLIKFWTSRLESAVGKRCVDFLTLNSCHSFSWFKLKSLSPQDFLALQGFCLSLFTIHICRAHSASLSRHFSRIYYWNNSL